MLKLEDYLSVQAHKQCSISHSEHDQINYRGLPQHLDLAPPEVYLLDLPKRSVVFFFFFFVFVFVFINIS